MPLASRTNAPRRLPSGVLEDPYFHPWVPRQSEGTDSRERSQGASSRSTPTSHVSPFTQAPDRKLMNADRKNFWSEPNALDPTPPLRGPHSSLGPTSSPAIASYEPSPRLQRRASTATFSSEESSLRLSISSKARNILGLPSTRVSPGAAKDALPARKARQGFRWIRGSSGHWLETRIKKKQSAGTSQASSEGATSPDRALTVDHSMDFEDRDSILVNESSSPHTQTAATETLHIPRSRMLESSSMDPFLSPEGPKEGLYCRTKRALGLKKGPITGDESGTFIYERAMTGETGLLLDSTSNALRYLATKGREPSNLSATPSMLSIASPQSANRWKHLRPGLASSTTSSSSSLRSLVRRRPPPPSPEPQRMYTGSDRNHYFLVELTEPDAPTFLPSEARRIITPPLGLPSASESTILHDPHFEYNLPHNAEKTHYISLDSTLPSKTRMNEAFMQTLAGEARKNLVSLPRGVPETEGHYFEMQTTDGFEGLSSEHVIPNVPEHLPTSPMCPKHPKHKSGGKGMCVYHGRNTTWNLPITPLSRDGNQANP